MFNNYFTNTNNASNTNAPFKSLSTSQNGVAGIFVSRRQSNGHKGSE